MPVACPDQPQRIVPSTIHRSPLAAPWSFVRILGTLASVCALMSCRKQPLPSEKLDFSSHTQREPSTPEARTLSAGCELTGKPTGELHLKTQDGAGTSRDYEALVPSTYDRTVPLALTFVYHGGGGTPAESKAWGIQNAVGAAAASIFVFPQGVAFQNYGVGWDDRCSGNDMAFFDNMVASLASAYCIDLNRVFAGGFSWGCDQVVALACCRGNKVRAIAAASCTDEFGDPTNFETYQACPVANGAAIRFTHATLGDSGYAPPRFATTLTLFRSWNACSPLATAADPSPCRSFTNCRVPVVDCPYDQLQHSVPTGWGEDSWKFFARLSH